MFKLKLISTGKKGKYDKLLFVYVNSENQTYQLHWIPEIHMYAISRASINSPLFSSRYNEAAITEALEPVRNELGYQFKIKRVVGDKR